MAASPEMSVRRAARSGGINGSSDSHIIQILNVREDPMEFLLNPSPFHEMAGVDPERFKRLNFKAAYKTIRWGTTTLRV